MVWFVSHCNDYNGRMKYVRMLGRHIGVDIYGECGDKTCGQTRSMGTRYNADTDPCFEMVNRRYKFYLSFENAICRDYVTEKAYNALKLDTIPVMFGGGDYEEILPPRSYIDALHFPDPADLAEPLLTLLLLVRLVAGDVAGVTPLIVAVVTGHQLIILRLLLHHHLLHTLLLRAHSCYQPEKYPLLHVDLEMN